MGRTKGGSLSHRQRQCFEARQQQLTAKEIGRSLNISPHTVAMHWRLAKLKIEAERGSPAVQGSQAMIVGTPESRAAACFRYLGFAALGFAIFSTALTLLGWLLLYFSPRFAYLWH